MDKVRVAAIQMGADIANRSSNVRRAKDLIRQAAKDGARLSVLPEMALDEFIVQWKDIKYYSYAEPVDGPTVQTFSELAKEVGTYIVLPLFEKDLPGIYYNSAVLISDEGEVVGVYRKNHIPLTLSYEKFYFTPGQGFPVFDTPFGRLGILICYDRKYPESWRCLIDQGATIIVNLISSWSYMGMSEAEIWEAELRTRACENQVFVIAANRCGKEEAYGFIGRSMIVSPRGKVLAAVNEEENVVVACDIDPDEVDEVRVRLPLLRDRRPDLY